MGWYLVLVLELERAVVSMELVTRPRPTSRQLWEQEREPVREPVRDPISFLQQEPRLRS